jgi:hypothetical protein
VATYKTVLDEPPGSLLVECHCPLFGFRLERLDLFEVLLHARQFPEDGVLFCVDSMESKVC